MTDFFERAEQSLKPIYGPDAPWTNPQRLVHLIDAAGGTIGGIMLRDEPPQIIVRRNSDGVFESRDFRPHEPYCPVSGDFFFERVDRDTYQCAYLG